jgi:hypothetical protein
LRCERGGADVIRLVFDQSPPRGPRVFVDGRGIEDVFSIELLPLRRCIVKHYRLPTAIVEGEVQFDIQAGEYEIVAEERA